MKKNRKGLVSVIIPLYKTDIYLVKRCIQSLLTGMFHNLEILLIDDGNSIQYANKLDKLISEKVVVIHSKHKGVCGARNTGIKRAGGQYIAFVDGDDIVSKDYLSEATFIMQENNVDIVCGGVRFEEASNSEMFKEFSLHLENGKVRVFNKNDINLLISNLFCDYKPTEEFKNYTNGSLSWKLYKKSLVEKVLFDEEITFLEDRVFNLEVFSLAEAIGITDSIWYTYYQYGNSSIHTYKSNSLENMTIVFRHCVKVLRRFPKAKSYACKWYMSNIYTCIYLDLLNKNNPYSFSQNKHRFEEWLNGDLWKKIKKDFTMDQLPFHSKIAAFLCLKNMPTLMLLYYKVTISLRRLKTTRAAG